ncbi:MAG: polysaccharide deacetylase family protein [bacterium]
MDSPNMMKALQFHRITPKFQFCGTWNTPEQFTIFLDQLVKIGAKVDLPKKNGKGIVITFDDGEDTIYKYAFPILKRYNIRALVFLIVNYIGQDNLWDISMTGKRVRHLNWNQILEMKKWGIEFGSHTMSHRNLTQMSKQEVEYEIFESKRVLDREIGGCRSISYPFNRVNQTIVETASKAGYEFGFGGDGRSLLLLRKEGIYITDTTKSFKTKVLEKPVIFYRYDRMKQKAINYFTIATMLGRKRKGIR